jgi:N-acetylneuraminic acid mutarotase
MMDRRALLASALAMSAAPAPAVARQAAWRERSPMPWATQEIYCAVHDGRIVTAGGLAARPGGMDINDRVASYDPAADAWSEGPRLPEVRHHPMLVSAAGKVWVFGGYGRGPDGDWTARPQVWVLGGDGWSAGPDMPGLLCETAGVTLGDRVHLATGRTPKGAANGGWGDQGDVDTHLVFDAASGRWDTARPAPMARNSAAGAVLDDRFWLAGGRTVEGGGTGRLDRYDPATDRWDTLAPIPASPATGRQVGGGLAMAVSGGRLVAFGGEWFEGGGGGGVFSETWIYDPPRDRWSEGPAMRTPRHGLAGAAVGEVVHAIGGGEVVSGGRASARVEALSF